MAKAHRAKGGVGSTRHRTADGMDTSRWSSTNWRSSSSTRAASSMRRSAGGQAGGHLAEPPGVSGEVVLPDLEEPVEREVDHLAQPDQGEEALFPQGEVLGGPGEEVLLKVLAEVPQGGQGGGVGPLETVPQSTGPHLPHGPGEVPVVELHHPL